MDTASSNSQSCAYELLLGLRRFSEIRPYLVRDLDCVIELGRGKPRRIESIKASGADLATMLEAGFGQLERLVHSSAELKARWDELLLSPYNNGPLCVSVARTLDCEAARCFPASKHDPAIIFHRSFAETELGTELDLMGVATAIRLFHLLGHVPFASQYKLLRTEYELLKKDVLLYRAITRDPRLQEHVGDFYSPEHLTVLKWFDTGNGFTERLDFVLAELERLENELGALYKNREKVDLYDVRVLQARRARIARAFEVADPDNPSSVLSQLKSSFTSYAGDGRNFLTLFLEVIGQRGIAAGRESFFFLNREPFGRIPFRHLKNPRIPCPWLAYWKRQYFGFSKKRRFSDGLGVTFAEDAPGFVQRMHCHPTVERTAYLTDNKALYFSKDPAVIGKITLLLEQEGQKAARAFMLQQGQWNPQTQSGVYIRPAFGDVTVMPANYMHSLFTVDDEHRSVDFTLKDPVTQIIKDFVPQDETEAEVRSPGINVGDDPQPSYSKNGVTIIRRCYGRYNTKLAINPDTGEMLVRLDENGRPAPVMYEPATLYNNLVVLESGAVTPEDHPIFRFNPVYPDEQTQFVYVFPYPKDLPVEWFLDFDDLDQELELHKGDPSTAISHLLEILMLKDRGWVDHSFLRAEVTAIGNNWHETKLFEGGDTVILDNSLNPDRQITRFRVRNVSLKNLALTLLIVELRDRQTVAPPHIPGPDDNVVLPC